MGLLGVIAQVPYMPDELWMIILSYLCGSVCDLVAMSAVNRQLRPLARRQETTDERPIFTEQEGRGRCGGRCGSGCGRAGWGARGRWRRGTLT